MPGLDAKPVIDVLVGMRIADLTKTHLDALRLLGYGYVRSRRGGLCLYRGRPRSHYVHVVEMGESEWQEQLLFRDYLRTLPEAVNGYAALKNELARGGARMASYALGKRKLIIELLVQAKRWGGRKNLNDKGGC